MNKKKNNTVLMFGPATGHNIIPYFNFFSTSKTYQLTFVYTGNIAPENQILQTIKFYKFSKSLGSLFGLIKEIKKASYIWHQGGYNVLELLLIYLFKKKETLFIINIWGEHVPKVAASNSLRGWMFRFFYKKCDVISCLWYGTKKIVDALVDPKKVKVLLWGLESSYFMEEERSLNSFTSEFIAQIPEHKTTFFYPKSFTESSNHEGILKAVKLLKHRNITDFVVYFWTGNISRGEHENFAKEAIEKYDLNENLKIVYHDFLPFYDIIKIWEKVDVGLQIVKNDQLSTTLLEPLIMKKEIMVSDIYPYQKMKEYFPELELTLTENDPVQIADEMKYFIEGNRTEEGILDVRKKVIEKEFNFEKNIQKMMDYYEELIKVKSK